MADRRKEGGKDGSAGKSLKRENKRGLDWMARVEWMVGWRGRGECSFLQYCRRIPMRANKLANRSREWLAYQLLYSFSVLPSFSMAWQFIVEGSYGILL